MLTLTQEKPRVQPTQSRELRITQWYQDVFPMACAYLRKRGGDLEAARELFQEALIIFYEKLLEDDFQPEMNDQAYLMGIVKKCWLRQRARSKPVEGLEGVEPIQENEPTLIPQKLMRYLKQSGRRCMDLLQSFYYERISMKELSERFGYKSERSATVQKYKCLEKVRDEIKQKSVSYEDFFE
ncbi:MAG: sigma-70 family RNA polymerase sigma factor [Bacteroidota bacterium]